MVHAWGQSSKDSMFMNDLNATAIQLKHVVRVLRDFPLKLRTYNDTIEYVRQIMYGFRLIVGNFDKFFSRYIGFGTFSNFFTQLTVFSLIIVLFVSIGSVAVIIWLSLVQSRHHAHLRQGAQYLLGLSFLFTLITAICNSLLVPFLYSHHDYLNHLMSSP